MRGVVTTFPHVLFFHSLRKQMQTVYVKRDFKSIVNVEALNNNLGQNTAEKFTKISDEKFCQKVINTVKHCIQKKPASLIFVNLPAIFSPRLLFNTIIFTCHLK